MSDKIYKRIIWFGIALILIFTPIARGTVMIWSSLPVIPIAILVFLWLWRMNNKGERFARTALDKPMLAFVLLAVISFVFSIYKHDSFFALLRLFGYIGVYYLVLNNFDHIMRRRLLGLVICIGAGLSIYGFLQYFGLLDHSWWFPPEFLAATYVNHNHFAGYLELVIPLAIGILFSRRLRSVGYRLGIIVALIIMITVFILTQSRGGWVCLASSLFVMNIVLIKQGRLSKKSLFVFLLVAVVIFSFVYFNREEISRRVETVTSLEEIRSETSLQARLKIWQGAAGMVRDNPLIGTGIGTFDWGLPRYRPQGLTAQLVYAHNDYLNMAAEMGILAPFIMLWAFIIVIAAGFKKEQFSPRRLGCAIGILSLSLHGLVDFNFHISANMLLFIVYMALIMSNNQEKRYA